MTFTDFKHVTLFFVIVFAAILNYAHAQIIPDLTTGDHYRPYLTENEKRARINNPKTPRAQTSQELNPQLYPHGNEDYMNAVKGTPADPSTVFTDRSKINYAKPLADNRNVQPAYAQLPQGITLPDLSVGQRNQAMIDADVQAYEAQRANAQERVNDAIKELYKPTIHYNLGVHHSTEAKRFEAAFDELTAMLEGKQKIDFLKAVWLVEGAVDNSLSWAEFSTLFNDDMQVITQIMADAHVSPTDNLAKLMAIYKFMADTNTVHLKGVEKPITTLPMLYDHDDYAARIDITKVFVSKLLRTGTGQCVSLPMLYYLYAKMLGAEAYIAFAPEHSYITFKDHLGNWQNIELTGRIFTTNDFYWMSGFIKAEQLKSGIYLRPISEKETVAYLMTTLAIAYVRTFGADDRLLAMAQTAHIYSPKSLTANMLVTGYANELWKNVVRQYQVLGLSEKDLAADDTAQQIKKQQDAAYRHIMKDLGYAKIPDWAYKQWQDGVNRLAAKQQHLVKKRQLEHQLNRR
ncbi:MAG: hypothetical protein JSS79_05530 [Bacteroidetes bacterium]|nr:hypothetical protein [Bacteroidota bacterium]